MKQLFIAIITFIFILNTTAYSQNNTIVNDRKRPSLQKSDKGITIASKQNGRWNQASTWQGGVVPTSVDNVHINHQVTVNNDFSCTDLTINGGGILNVSPIWYVYIYGNFQCNGTVNLFNGTSSYNTSLFIYGNATFNSSATINSGGEYTEISFYGTQQQTFNNNTTFPKVGTIGVANSSGVTFNSNSGLIKTTRLNLFYGNITNSDKLQIGDGTVAVIQRGEPNATATTAGTLDKAPVLTMGTANQLYILYSNSQSIINAGFEVPSANIIYYLLADNAKHVNLSKNITVKNTVNIGNGDLQIGNATLTLENSNLNRTGSGTLVGGITSKLTLSGDTSVVNVPAITLNNLTLNKSIRTTLAGDVTLTSSLTLTKGILKTGTKNIIFTNTAQNPIETNNARIEGTSKMNARNVGTSTLDFLGCYFAAGIDNLGNVQVTRITGPSAIISNNGNQSIAARWDITADNQPASGRNMTYKWLSANDNNLGFGASNRGQVYVSTNSGTNWASIGTLINPVINSTQREITVNTTHYSQWVVGSENGVLPVKLNSFTHSVASNSVTLRWSTSQEVNNDGFEIYRSEAGKENFVKAGFVKGAGNKNEVTNYTFTDSKLNTGKYTYRLKQIDFNGNFEFFTLSSEVSIEAPKKFKLSQNYPNPFNPVTKIDFEISDNSQVSINIYDLTGKLVTTLVNDTRQAGIYTVDFNASELSSGIYIYKINVISASSSFTDTKKMTLIK